jgi:hypothetical protein
MNRSFKLCIFVLVLCAGGTYTKASVQTDSLWVDPYVTDDSITVCSRTVPESGILELRAECIVNVPSGIVFRTAMRRDTYQHTSKYVVDYRIIQTDSSNVWYTYQRLAIPIFQDRDYTLRYEAMLDSIRGDYSLVWTIANEKGPPPRENVVRVQASRGALEMVPVEAGTKTRLTCTIYADPGGSIPGWLANIGNRSTVPNLLRAIRDKSMAEHDSRRADEH